MKNQFITILVFIQLILAQYLFGLTIPSIKIDSLSNVIIKHLNKYDTIYKTKDTISIYFLLHKNINITFSHINNNKDYGYFADISNGIKKDLKLLFNKTDTVISVFWRDTYLKEGKIIYNPTINSIDTNCVKRSRDTIQSMIINNSINIRTLYNNRLNKLKIKNGIVFVKFAIDEYGKIIYCKIISSTISDVKLESGIVNEIIKWKFGKISCKGDITEINYPFNFEK